MSLFSDGNSGFNYDVYRECHFNSGVRDFWECLRHRANGKTCSYTLFGVQTQMLVLTDVDLGEVLNLLELH